MYQRILVGTDGSKTAAKAVARAVEVAKMFGASVTVMTAGRGSQANAVVDAAVAEHESPGLTIEGIVVAGDPVEALIETARAGGYDLVVVGNKGMTGLTRFFKVGSVPNKLSHHLPTSLLIVQTT